MRASRTTLLLVAALTLLPACGGTDEALDDDPVITSPSATAPVQGPQSQRCDGTPAVLPAPPGSSTNLTTKPSVPETPAEVPALQVYDVVVGTGPVACAGASLTVRYVGVLAASGKQFDASWDRGADSTFPFTLGQGDVIQGWDRGLVGMREGGRRQLVIPAEQGYGAQGFPPDIPGGATLVFVVDLVRVG